MGKLEGRVWRAQRYRPRGPGHERTLAARLPGARPVDRVDITTGVRDPSSCAARPPRQQPAQVPRVIGPRSHDIVVRDCSSASFGALCKFRTANHSFHHALAISVGLQSPYEPHPGV